MWIWYRYITSLLWNILLRLCTNIKLHINVPLLEENQIRKVPVGLVSSPFCLSPQSTGSSRRRRFRPGSDSVVNLFQKRRTVVYARTPENYPNTRRACVDLRYHFSFLIRSTAHYKDHNIPEACLLWFHHLDKGKVCSFKRPLIRFWSVTSSRGECCVYTFSTPLRPLNRSRAPEKMEEDSKRSVSPPVAADACRE